MTGGYWGWRRKRPAKTAADHYRDRRLRRKKQVAAGAAFPVTVGMIADRDNLFDCYRDLRRSGGHAPGSDGVRLPDLSDGEAGELVADLAERVATFRYAPQPPRRVEIPKPGGTKTRTLSIPAVLDRVLAKALYRELEPYWERVFLDCSWGFRPGRGTWGMLLAVDKAVGQSGYTVLAVDDLKSAFENTPLDAVLAAHGRLLARIEQAAPPVTGRTQVTRRDEKKKLLWLVDAVLRGDDPARARGLPQGNNYSPCALNAVLHDWLDGPVTSSMVHPLWFRYADNLCYLCPGVPEGEQALAVIRQLLAPLGMSLKGVDGVSDLRTRKAQLLGFSLKYRDEKLVYGLGKKARDQLRRGLEEAYGEQNPNTSALEVLRGWVSSYGPAFETGGTDPEEVLTIAAEYGFRELASPDEVRRWMQSSSASWSQFRTRNGGPGGGEGLLPTC